MVSCVLKDSFWEIMSRKTGTKNKKCLLFQFYRIDSVYFSSLFSMSILTRNMIEVMATTDRNQPIKRSVCARQMVSRRPSGGHRQTKWWASTAQVMSTCCPHVGHRVPIVWGYFWALYLSKHFVVSFVVFYILLTTISC